jgi:hypothetical protein
MECGRCGVAAKLCCAKCNKVAYCNKECQIQDWSNHKLVCGNHPNDPTKFYVILNLVVDGSHQFATVVENLLYPPHDVEKNNLLDIDYHIWPPQPPGTPTGQSIMHAVISVPLAHGPQLMEVARLPEVGMICVPGLPSYPCMITQKRIIFPMILGPNVFTLMNKERPAMSEERLGDIKASQGLGRSIDSFAIKNKMKKKNKKTKKNNKKK